MGGSSPLFLKGGDNMTVFEALVLMISFSTLIVAILSQQKK
ncbi:putative holin-like toxin [Oceanobacillus massiliensis]